MNIQKQLIKMPPAKVMHSESRVRKYSFSMIQCSGTKHMPNVVISIKQPGKISSLIIKFRKYNHSVAKTTDILFKKKNAMNSHTPWKPRLLNSKISHLIEMNIWPQKQSSMKLLKWAIFKLTSSSHHEFKVNQIKSYQIIFLSCIILDYFWLEQKLKYGCPSLKMWTWRLRWQVPSVLWELSMLILVF